MFSTNYIYYKFVKLYNDNIKEATYYLYDTYNKKKSHYFSCT